MNENELVEEPLFYDILCGRGRDIEQHPGNRHFADLMRQFQELYAIRSMRGEAQTVIDVIMRFLLERPHLRFLERNDDGNWKVASQRTVRKKVGQVWLRSLL